LAIRKDKRIKGILQQELRNIDDLGSLILESIVAFGDKSFIELLKNKIQENKITQRINEKWLLNCIKELETA